MGTFNSSKTLYASSTLIPTIAQDITATFKNEEYEVQSQQLKNGGYDISITKGGVFKAIIGMKTALKVNIIPNTDYCRCRYLWSASYSDGYFHALLLARPYHADFWYGVPV